MNRRLGFLAIVACICGAAVVSSGCVLLGLVPVPCTEDHDCPAASVCTAGRCDDCGGEIEVLVDDQFDGDTLDASRWKLADGDVQTAVSSIGEGVVELRASSQIFMTETFDHTGRWIRKRVEVAHREGEASTVGSHRIDANAPPQLNVGVTGSISDSGSTIVAERLDIDEGRCAWDAGVSPGLPITWEIFQRDNLYAVRASQTGAEAIVPINISLRSELRDPSTLLLRTGGGAVGQFLSARVDTCEPVNIARDDGLSTKVPGCPDTLPYLPRTPHCDAADCVGAPLGGRRYLACPTGRAWEDAACYCASQNGSLPKIGSAEQNSDVGTAAAALNSETAFFWIGLSDQDVEDAFVWQDGSDADFAPFTGGQPDNGAGVEDCVGLIVDGPSAGQWGDFDCLRSFPFVCDLGADGEGEGEGEGE